MIYTPSQIYLGDQIEKNYMSRNVPCVGERRVAYRVLMGKSEGKRPPRRTRRRLEDNIKMDLQKVRWGHGLYLSGSG